MSTVPSQAQSSGGNQRPATQSRAFVTKLSRNSVTYASYAVQEGLSKLLMHGHEARGHAAWHLDSDRALAARYDRSLHEVMLATENALVRALANLQQSKTLQAELEHLLAEVRQLRGDSSSGPARPRPQDTWAF